MAELIGWASSLILLATIGTQVHKQWRDRRTAGISRWLFIGQVLASIGFTTYSLLLRNWVFVVTNAALLLSALFGCYLYFHNRRTARLKQEAPPDRDPK